MKRPFRCLRCGACCCWKGYVRLTAQETDAIAEYLGVSPETFIREHTRLTGDRSGLSLLERGDGSCEWYDAAGKACLINPVKPGQCTAFPVYWNFPGWDTNCAAGAAARKKGDPYDFQNC